VNVVRDKFSANRHAERSFCNGMDFYGVIEQLDKVRDHARQASRDMSFGLNRFVIARDTEKAAKVTLKEIVAKANRPAVESFRQVCNRLATPQVASRGCGPIPISMI
jgi:dimethylsulfone monooxygenase